MTARALWIACGIAAATTFGCDPKRGGPAAMVDAGAPASASTTTPTAVDPEKLVAQNCLTCHSEEMLKQQRLTAAQWEKVVKKMVGWGALVAPDDAPLVATHLASKYGPDAGAYAFATVRPDDAARETAPLEDGPFAKGDEKRGEALFQARCAACHGPGARGVIGVALVDRPIVHRAADVAKTVRTGRASMPAQPDTTDAEIADLVAHLRGLTTQRVTGGGKGAP